MKIVLRFAFVLLVVAGPALAAQDSIRTVILSDRVGGYIDPAERERFGLFPTVRGFRGARVLLIRDSALVVAFDILGEDGSVARVVKPYSAQILLLMAEKIEHFEMLQTGRYAMGSEPISLSRITGGVAQLKRALTATAKAAPELRPRPDPGDPGIDERGSEVPIGQAGDAELPQTFPQFGITAGIAEDGLDDEGVADLLDQVEDSYRRAGYPLSRYIFSRDRSPIYYFGATLMFSPALGVSIGYTRSSTGIIDLRGACITARFSPSIPGVDFIRPFVEAGVQRSRYIVDFLPRYGVRISPVDSVGRYKVLDAVKVSGSARITEGVLGGGIEFGHVEGFFPGIAAFVRYYSGRSIPLEAGKARASVTTSRVIMGASITIYFE